MKNKANHINSTGIRQTLKGLALTTGICVSFGSGIALAETEWEYEPGEGYHQEEWYDPGDWFNEDDKISYESDSTWNDGNWSHIYHPYTYTYYWWDPVDLVWTDRERNQQTASNQNDQSQQTKSNLEGTIDGFKSVSLSDRQGVKENHDFVKVDLKNGTSRIVSLGSSLDVGDLQLKKGDKISASGRVVNLDGKKILLANSVRTGGESFSISKSKQPDIRNQQGNNSGESVVTRSGTLKDVARVQLDDEKQDKNLIVRLEMKDGRSCVVDLGPNTAMQDLDLSKGDIVWIKGEKCERNGKSLIVADKLRIDGKRQNIDAQPSKDTPESSDMEQASGSAYKEEPATN